MKFKTPIRLTNVSPSTKNLLTVAYEKKEIRGFQRNVHQTWCRFVVEHALESVAVHFRKSKSLVIHAFCTNQLHRISERTSDIIEIFQASISAQTRAVGTIRMREGRELGTIKHDRDQWLNTYTLDERISVATLIVKDLMTQTVTREKTGDEEKDEELIKRINSDPFYSSLVFNELVSGLLSVSELNWQDARQGARWNDNRIHDFIQDRRQNQAT